MDGIEAGIYYSRRRSSTYARQRNLETTTERNFFYGVAI